MPKRAPCRLAPEMTLTRFFFLLVLAGVAWGGQPPGLTATQCFVFVQDLASDPNISDMRGNLRLRNDSGKMWTEAQVTVHVMNGYGAPIFNFKGPVYPSWGVREQKDIPIFQPNYRGSVRIFQLGAEVNAKMEGQAVHFEIPPTDAAGGTPSTVNY